MKKLEIYCVTNKLVPNLEKTSYNLACVGKDIFPDNYIKSDLGDNIFFKEKYYSELTFHYWFWKNLLPKIDKSTWIGFCQRRRFWIKESSIKDSINKDNLLDNLLYYPEIDWINYESIITKPISLTKIKISKIFKRGLRSLVKSPSILFSEKKRNIKLHFDMHHGYGNLFKAINLLDNNDKDDFLKYVRSNTKFNPNIMFIAKKKIIQNWFNSLFPWLERCEKVFGFDNLKGYDTTRLYAFLAERYLSFWFKKYSKFEEKKWILLDFKD